MEYVFGVRVNGSIANGRWEKTSVVSAYKRGRIISGDVESPPLLPLLLLRLLLLLLLLVVLLLGNSCTSPVCEL